jgi:hypothetical protein
MKYSLEPSPSSPPSLIIVKSVGEIKDLPDVRNQLRTDLFLVGQVRRANNDVIFHESLLFA